MIRILLPFLSAASRAQASWRTHRLSRRALMIDTAAAGAGLKEAPAHGPVLIGFYTKRGNNGVLADRGSEIVRQHVFAPAQSR